MVKHSICIFAAALSLVACGGNKCGISGDEKDLIMTQTGRTMRLLTIEDRNDSLFLRSKSKELTVEDFQSVEYRALKEGMLLTVTDSVNGGVGIAAPQVGVGCRLVAVKRADKVCHPFEFFANPRIIGHSGEKRIGREGCLSIPYQRGYVERYDTITIEYINDVDFTTCTETVGGFTAVELQHEIDHLDGILYIDIMDERIYVDKLAIEHPEYLPSIKVGTPAPDFEASSIDGSKLRLSDFKDKIVVLDFWASWCGDCRREMAEIKQLQAEYAEKDIFGCDVQFIGYSFDRDEASWKKYVEDEDITWPQVSTLQPKWHDIQVTSDYGLNWIPGFVVVAPHSQKVMGRAISAKGLRQVLVDISHARTGAVR